MKTVGRCSTRAAGCRTGPKVPVAGKLAALKTSSGPDTIGVLASAKCTNEENYLMQKFARQVIGTHNVDHCARLCHASTVAGLAMAFGSGAMSNSMDDIANLVSPMELYDVNPMENYDNGQSAFAASASPAPPLDDEKKEALHAILTVAAFVAFVWRRHLPLPSA